MSKRFQKYYRNIYEISFSSGHILTSFLNLSKISQKQTPLLNICRQSILKVPHWYSLLNALSVPRDNLKPRLCRDFIPESRVIYRALLSARWTRRGPAGALSSISFHCALCVARPLRARPV